ncbi:hypothetical protein V8G54_018195 [Vigna mungo]|uniref:Uncharacterized protein n=1 Tax=Vigna mungo TaxID=3915 RepID=A0AAQ3RUC4_VIGMU
MIEMTRLSGPPANVKYKPFTGWLAKAICCTGPTKFEITALDFVNVPRMRLATASCPLSLPSMSKSVPVRTTPKDCFFLLIMLCESRINSRGVEILVSFNFGIGTCKKVILFPHGPFALVLSISLID